LERMLGASSHSSTLKMKALWSFKTW